MNNLRDAYEKWIAKNAESDFPGELASFLAAILSQYPKGEYENPSIELCWRLWQQLATQINALFDAMEEQAAMDCDYAPDSAVRKYYTAICKLLGRKPDSLMTDWDELRK